MSGIAAGLAAMVGLFVLLEVLNRTIRRPVELTNALRGHAAGDHSLYGNPGAFLDAPLAQACRSRGGGDRGAAWRSGPSTPITNPIDLIYGRLLAQLGL